MECLRSRPGAGSGFQRRLLLTVGLWLDLALRGSVRVSSPRYCSGSTGTRPTPKSAIRRPPTASRIALAGSENPGLVVMVAAVTVASEPITVLAAVAHTRWARRTGPTRPSPRCEPAMYWDPYGPADVGVVAAATRLGLLSIAMMIFILALALAQRVGAATAGLACLLAGRIAHAPGAARGQLRRTQTAVMAASAVAWAGSKPIASLGDGTLAAMRLPAHRIHAGGARPRAGSRRGPPAVSRRLVPPRSFTPAS